MCRKHLKESSGVAVSLYIGAVPSRGTWAKLEAKGDSPKWTQKLESRSNIKHKCAFQAPATCLWGLVVWDDAVHFCCSLPCVTALSSFTLIIYNHKMKSQDRRKMSWF